MYLGALADMNRIGNVHALPVSSPTVTQASIAAETRSWSDKLKMISLEREL